MSMVRNLPYDHPYRWDGRQFGGPRLWRPSHIGSSLALWLDAEDAASITLNGSTVSQWSDKSGNGRNATQAAAASQPAYVAGSLQGKPAFTFDGADDFLNVDGTWAVNTNYSLFAVIARRSSKSNNFAVAGLGTTANSNLFIGWGADTAFRAGQFGNDATINVSAYASPELTLGAWQHSSTDAKLLARNGTTTTWANTTALPSNVSWSIGRFAYGMHFSGDVCEVIGLTAFASTADRQRLEGYLAHKWWGPGAANTLPDAHPHKFTPPFA